MTWQQTEQKRIDDRLRERWNEDGTRKSDRDQVRAVCDQMMAQLDNPISPSGRYGLSSVINDSKPFTGLTTDTAYGIVGKSDLCTYAIK